MWAPDPTGVQEDLLATSGDFLRLYQVSGSEVKPRAVLYKKTVSSCFSFFLFLGTSGHHTKAKHASQPLST